METGSVKELVAAWVNEKLVADPTYFLVDIKMPGVKTLQVFIDGDSGITISKCAEISRYLESRIEEKDLLGEKYTLEVSSPGLNNPLKVYRQYKRRIGSPISVVKADGQRFDGTLVQIDEETITLEQEFKEKNKVIKKDIVNIPFAEIKRTKLNFKF